MLYIKRDDEGRIELLSREPSADCTEEIDPDTGEVMAFLSGQSEHAASFIASDLAFVRVMEDILEVLMSKGVISFTDLPTAAQQKVMARQSLRRDARIDLLGEENDTI